MTEEYKQLLRMWTDLAKRVTRLERLGAEGSACSGLIGRSGAEDGQDEARRAKPGEVRAFGHDEGPVCPRCGGELRRMHDKLWCPDGCFYGDADSPELRRAERETPQREEQDEQELCPLCGDPSCRVVQDIGMIRMWACSLSGTSPAERERSDEV